MTRRPKTYEELEEQLPRYARNAVRIAYRKAMRTAGYVIKAQDGFLVKAYADGRCERLKKLPEPTEVKAGVKYRIR